MLFQYASSCKLLAIISPNFQVLIILTALRALSFSVMAGFQAYCRIVSKISFRTISSIWCSFRLIHSADNLMHQLPVFIKFVYFSFMQMVARSITLVPVIFMFAVLLLSGYHTNVFAGNRVGLGRVNQMPLSSSNDPDVLKALSHIRYQIKLNGFARIIVGLNVPYAPEGTLIETDIAQQRNEISRVQNFVLENIPSLTKRSGHIKRYETLPFLALEVDSAEFETLLNLIEVTSIEEDVAVAPVNRIE